MYQKSGPKVMDTTTECNYLFAVKDIAVICGD
jgi:hypothetical protein